MDAQRAEAVFREREALLDGHFCLTSGLHSSAYMQCARVLQHPDSAAELCADLADRWRDAGIDVVVGPATGGIIIAYEIARQLGVRAVFCERVDGVMKALRRGFHIEPGERVIAAEDVMTTGGSVAEMVEALEGMGAEIAGVCCLVDRGGLKRFARYDTAAVLTVDLPTYQPEDCPLCKQGLPIDKPGSKGTQGGAA